VRKALIAGFAMFLIAGTSVSASTAAVRKVSFTARVPVNGVASLTVSVKPRSRCTIRVVYGTTVSHAKGLAPKTGSRVTWRWKVGLNTPSGSWPITVACNRAGKLTLRMRVVGN
jgi:hypothetical protein